MGLLDDAIREHLELKRRRGADPTEVSRQESEALGPVRRDRGPATEEDPLGAPPVEEYEGDEEPGDAYDDGIDRGPEEYEPAGPATPYDAAADPPAGAAGPPGAVAAPADDGPPTEFADPPAAGGRAAEEWGFEDEEPEPEPEEPEPDEDVLEETPEFLQETPEHDRLWFEQKPPRDFDFDG
jgi:hypothetical protein